MSHRTALRALVHVTQQPREYLLAHLVSAYRAHVPLDDVVHDVRTVVVISLQLKPLRRPGKTSRAHRVQLQPVLVVLHLEGKDGLLREHRGLQIAPRQRRNGLLAALNRLLGPVGGARVGGNDFGSVLGVFLGELNPLGVVVVAVEEKTHGCAFEHYVEATVVSVLEVAREMAKNGAILVLALYEKVRRAVAVGARAVSVVKGNGKKGGGKGRIQLGHEMHELNREVVELALPFDVVPAEILHKGNAKRLTINGLRLSGGKSIESRRRARALVELVVQIRVQVGGEAFETHAVDEEALSQF